MSGTSNEGFAQTGKYRLLHELGRGGMGVVYLAEDTRLRRQVALKILHPALTLDSGFVAGFVREAQAIAALTHPGIVRVHAIEEIGGSHLIDMEYIDGNSLDQILLRGPIDRPDALGIVNRVLNALAACHIRNMIHRDVKPANILIAYDGRILLSDFGLAMSFGLSSVATATSSCFIGTPKYAPPESWDKVPPSPAGDVYSTGLVLLELLAGKTPFDGDSPLDIMRKTIDASAVPVRDLLPDISDDLASLLEDMLDVTPANRPKDAGVALQRLRETEEFLDLPDGGTETMRVTPPGGLRRPRVAHRAPRWLALAAATFVMLVAGFTWYLLPSSEPTIVPTEEITKLPDAPSTTPVVSPDVAHLAAVGDYVVFTAVVGDWRSLWSYNTTTGDVVPLWPELSLGPDDNVFKDGGHPVANGMVGVVRTKSDGIRLFRTDGTPEGTTVLAYATSVDANRIELLGARDGKVWFNRIAGDNTFGLWETDGTIEGTRQRWGDRYLPIVTGIRFTQSGGMYFTCHTTGALYHWPKDAEEPYLLWPADSGATSIGEFLTLDEQVIAEASDGNRGRELWGASPKPGSLRLIHEFYPGEQGGLQDPQMAPFRDGAVIVATTPESGRELWFTDGTDGGTRFLRDINPGPMDASPYRFTESGGLLFFSALTAENGQELWVSDGTHEGTRMVRDIAPGVASGNPFAFCEFGDGLLFTADDGVHGEELWFSDGTTEGTHLLFDCLPGPEDGGAHGTLLVGNRALFGADHPTLGRVLWETDGTATGTKPLFDRLDAVQAPMPASSPWATLGDRIVIVNTTSEYGAELWVTDATNATTTLVRDIFPGPQGSFPHDFKVFDGYIYFAADDGIHGTELWRSNGTRDGTELVYDAYLGAKSGTPREFIQWGEDHLVFTARLSQIDIVASNAILCISKGTNQVQIAGGTTNRGPQWNPTNLTDGGEWLFFSTQSSDGQTVLWRTNINHTEGLPALGLGEAPARR